MEDSSDDDDVDGEGDDEWGPADDAPVSPVHGGVDVDGAAAGVDATV